MTPIEKSRRRTTVLESDLTLSERKTMRRILYAMLLRSGEMPTAFAWETKVRMDFGKQPEFSKYAVPGPEELAV